MLTLTNQFYFKNDTLVFNDSATTELLDGMSLDTFSLNGIVKFDLRSISTGIKSFLKKLLGLVLKMNVKGVTMYVSKEVDYLKETYESKEFDTYNNNPIVILDSSDKVDVVFFNGIDRFNIQEVKTQLTKYKNQKVVFNFSNLDLHSLNNFIPTFIGWMINSGLKNISFSKHYGEVQSLLEKNGVFCMVKVSNLISFPKKKAQKIENVQNEKINKFLRFANYGALQF